MFDMLEIALKYCKAIDSITAAHDLQLLPFELSTTEWKITEQLCGILNLSSHLSPFSHVCN